MKFRVVRIDNGPRNPQTGVVSNHRTLAAAQAAIDRADKRLRRTRGFESAWNPFVIESLASGEREWVRVSRG